jgi:hypothetical protein
MLGIFIVMAIIFVVVKLMNLAPKINRYAADPSAFDEKTVFARFMRTKPMTALCGKITARKARRAEKTENGDGAE